MNENNVKKGTFVNSLNSGTGLELRNKEKQFTSELELETKIYVVTKKKGTDDRY